MQRLDEYIQRNRENIPSVIVHDEWYGEMCAKTRSVFYDVPTLSGQKRVFVFLR